MFLTQTNRILNRQDVINRGLIAWLPLDQAAGALAWDISSKGAHGTITAPILAGGYSGNALRFNGSSSVVTVSSSRINLASRINVSISAWMRRSATSSIVTVGKSVSANNRVNINLFSDGNVYINVGTGAAAAYGGFALNDIFWHHYLLAFNGNETGNENRAKLYVDGLQRTLTFTGTIPNNTSSTTDEFTIGRDQASSNYSTGFVQNVRVWTRTLNSTDARNLYKEPFIGLLAPSVSKYYVVTAGGSLIKTWHGVPIAQVKTWNGIPIAQVKTLNGVANV